MAFAKRLLVLTFLHQTACQTSMTRTVMFDAHSSNASITLSCTGSDWLLDIHSVSHDCGVCPSASNGYLDGSTGTCTNEQHIRYNCFGRRYCSSILSAPECTSGVWANDLRVQYDCIEKRRFVSICNAVDTTFHDMFFLRMPWHKTPTTSCQCAITPLGHVTYSVMRMAWLHSSNNFTVHFIGVNMGVPYVYPTAHYNPAYLLPERLYPGRNENVTVHIQAAPPGFAGDSRVFTRIIGGSARVVCRRERAQWRVITKGKGSGFTTTDETSASTALFNIEKDQVEDNSNGRLIAGIVVSVLLGIILISIIVYCRKKLLMRRSAQKKEGSPAEQQPLANEPGLIKSPSHHELESPNKMDEEDGYAAILEDRDVYSEPVLPYAVSDAVAKGDLFNNSQAAAENPYNPVDTFRPSKLRKLDEAARSEPVDVHLASPSPSEYDDPYQAAYGAVPKSGHAPGEEVVQLVENELYAHS